MSKATKSATWKLADTTRGKHLVLREYLRAWLPIVGSRFDQLRIIDGFAGPGSYEGGEPGSPSIALQCIQDANVNRALAKLRITALFIEHDPAVFNHLQGTVAEMDIPPFVEPLLSNSTFDEEANALLDAQHNPSEIVPTFALIDPMGISDVRMSTIRRLLARPATECMISLMYDWIH